MKAKSKFSKTSSRKRRELELQKLEDERALQERIDNEEFELKKQMLEKKRQREEEYLNKKLNLNLASDSTDDSDESCQDDDDKEAWNGHERTNQTTKPTSLSATDGVFVYILDTISQQNNITLGGQQSIRQSTVNSSTTTGVTPKNGIEFPATIKQRTATITKMQSIAETSKFKANHQLYGNKEQQFRSQYPNTTIMPVCHKPRINHSVLQLLCPMQS